MSDLLATTGAGGSPLATLMLISELIPDRFEYRRGATYVDSTVEDLLEVGAGVCQDFVHLGLVLLRHHGIAARYVSGYLFAAADDKGEESIEVDTHAWLEALLPVLGGGEPAWIAADPTNRGLVDENHVKIGHGRHYPDVPDQGRVPRRGDRRARRARDDDAARRPRPGLDRPLLATATGQLAASRPRTPPPA